MGDFKEIDGDLIRLALDGEFDMIAQGCNCFCRMKSGIAKTISEIIPDAVEADNRTQSGDASKLGTYTVGVIWNETRIIGKVLNCYTQYNYGTDTQHADYNAITRVMGKINADHRGKSIGLPLIGCGRAGGDWEHVKNIIKSQLRDMDVTIVHYNGNYNA